MTVVRGEQVEGRVSESEICVGSGSPGNFGSTCVPIDAEGGVVYQLTELGQPAVSTLIVYLASYASSVEITRDGQPVDAIADDQFVSAVLGSQRDVTIEVRWADGSTTSVDLADLLGRLGEPGSTGGGLIEPVP